MHTYAGASDPDGEENNCLNDGDLPGAVITEAGKKHLSSRTLEQQHATVGRLTLCKMLPSQGIEDREARSHDETPGTLPPAFIRPRRKLRVALLHSEIHTQVLYQAMSYIHKDRDILLGSLLECCGFLQDTPSFFKVVAPKPATRKHLEHFHDEYYIDLLEFENMEHELETANPIPSRETIGFCRSH